jgi:hypothetical protein
VAVRGGSVRGEAALVAIGGARAVVEGAVLEARPAGEVPTSVVQAENPASTVVLRRCELLVPPVGTQFAGATASEHFSLVVAGGARATAAGCTCSGRAIVVGQGSALLHSGLAFPLGLEDPIFEQEGGLARELPGAADRAGGPRAAAPAPAAAPPGAGSQGAGSALVAAAGAAESVQPSAGTGGSGPVGEAAAAAEGLGSLALGGA